MLRKHNGVYELRSIMQLQEELGACIQLRDHTIKYLTATESKALLTGLP